MVKIKESCSQFDQEMTKIDCKLLFKGNKLTSELSAAEMRKVWEDYLTNLISKPKTLDTSETWRKYAAKIEQDCIGDIEYARETINSNLKLAEEFLLNPEELKFFILLDEDSETIRNGNLESIEQWESVIQKVKLRKLRLDGHKSQIDKGKISFLLSGFKEDYEKSILFAFEEIATGMRDNINNDVATLEGFVLGAQQILKSKVNSIEELSKVKKEYEKLKLNYEEYETKLEELDRKSRVLSDFGGMAITQINLPNLRRKWDNFAVKITSFEHVLSNSGDQIKSEIKRKLNESNSAIEKFYIKITGFDITNIGPMDRDEEKKFSGRLRDVKREWDDLQLTLGPLLASADDLDIDLSDMESLHNIRQYFKGPFAAWTVYFEFLNELEKFEAEEWLNLKSNLHDFYVFSKKWNEASEDEKESSYKIIYNQTNIYKTIYPA